MLENQQNYTKRNPATEKPKEQKNQISFQADLPYPPVNCERKNSMYARIMLDNMAGTSSEMSAISFYLYTHFMSDEHKELSTIFFNISKVEMHHLHIFGTLSKQLGADPRLWTPRNNQAVYWSPGFVQYPKQPQQMLEIALKDERAAAEKYSKQINVIKDENIV